MLRRIYQAIIESRQAAADREIVRIMQGRGAYYV